MFKILQVLPLPLLWPGIFSMAITGWDTCKASDSYLLFTSSFPLQNFSKINSQFLLFLLFTYPTSHLHFKGWALTSCQPVKKEKKRKKKIYQNWHQERNCSWWVIHPAPALRPTPPRVTLRVTSPYNLFNSRKMLLLCFFLHLFCGVLSFCLPFKCWIFPQIHL